MKRIMAALLLIAVLLLPVSAAETVPETTGSTETVETMQYEPFDLPTSHGEGVIFLAGIGSLVAAGILAIVGVRLKKGSGRNRRENAHE